MPSLGEQTRWCAFILSGKINMVPAVATLVCDVSLQESEAGVQNAVRELEAAAARLRAAEQQLAQESELRSSAEQHAAKLEAILQSLEAEKAAHEAKVKPVI